MICLDSEARHLKQRPFSGPVINVNKNTGAGYSPIISIHCVNVAISKTSITLKSVFFIRCRRSDSSIFVDKWNLTAATIASSFSQQPQAAIRRLRTWPRIHVQPRFQWGFRNGVTFLRVVYVNKPLQPIWRFCTHTLSLREPSLKIDGSDLTQLMVWCQSIKLAFLSLVPVKIWKNHQGPILLTWFNFSASMGK